MHTVKCPQCNTPVVWNEQSKYRPFCSKRCQLLDLGCWFDEAYQIVDNETLDCSKKIIDS